MGTRGPFERGITRSSSISPPNTHTKSFQASFNLHRLIVGGSSRVRRDNPTGRARESNRTRPPDSHGPERVVHRVRQVRPFDRVETGLMLHMGSGGRNVLPARIIYERFCCNRRFALRQAWTRFGRSTYCFKHAPSLGLRALGSFGVSTVSNTPLAPICNSSFPS